MKQVFFLVLIFALSFNVVRAEENDYKAFLGKWKFELFETPDGDIEAVFAIEKKDDGLVGSIVGDDKNYKLYNISVKGKELTCYFDADGNEVEIFIELTAEDKFEGYLNDMYEVIGSKIKK